MTRVAPEHGIELAASRIVVGPVTFVEIHAKMEEAQAEGRK